MTRITNHLHKNVFSVIMDIFEMDHFREPELEELQFFLESTGTHGSIVRESALEMDCSEIRIQSLQNVLFDSEESFSSIN
jgi:predicted SAM-dependent methyltransferase